jgi:hypothetical protein
MSDKAQSKLMAVDEQNQYNWRMGTGFHDKGDKLAYELASNRTYLIADVWGYSSKLQKESRRTPEVTFTCLSAKAPATGK